MTRLITNVSWLVAISTIGLGVLYKKSGEFSYTIPDAFINSNTMKIVNPNGHKIQTDSLNSIISTSKSCDELLTRYSKGFFGGPAMSIERSIFRLIWKGKCQVVAFSQLYGDIRPETTSKILWNMFLTVPYSSSVVTIWDPKDISSTEILPLGTILYGGFQISNYEKTEKGCYLDVIFGSDLTTFSGSHRLEVVRLDEDRVQVFYHHFRCNPVERAESPMEYAKYFHYFYSRALFYNALYEIQKV